jgi:hypothetical protein
LQPFITDPADETQVNEVCGLCVGAAVATETIKLALATETSENELTDNKNSIAMPDCYNITPPSKVQRACEPDSGLKPAEV